MKKGKKSCRQEACEMIVKDLEVKYLGEQSRKVLEDKYFRMLLHGMTQEEAESYSHAKMVLIKDYHV